MHKIGKTEKAWRAALSEHGLLVPPGSLHPLLAVIAWTPHREALVVPFLEAKDAGFLDVINARYKVALRIDPSFNDHVPLKTGFMLAAICLKMLRDGVPLACVFKEMDKLDSFSNIHTVVPTQSPSFGGLQ